MKAHLQERDRIGNPEEPDFEEHDEEVAKEIFKIEDTDHNGYISWPEFVATTFYAEYEINTKKKKFPKEKI